MNHIAINGHPEPNIATLLAKAIELDKAGTLQAVANHRRSLRRIIAIAQNTGTEFEEISLTPRRGPKVEFIGKAIGVKDAPFHTQHDDDATLTIEVWVTPGGALIGSSTLSSMSSGGGDTYEETRCVVVEASEDADAMRSEIMDFFNWTSHARDMARDMGWSFKRWVD